LRVWADRMGHFGLDIDKYKERAETLSPNLRPLKGPDGEVVGRACVNPVEGPYERVGAITVGGLRTASVAGLAGIFKGTAVRATRDAAAPVVEESELQSWASEQAAIAAASFDDPGLLSRCAAIIRACGGDVKALPVAYSSRGWLTIPDISSWTDVPDVVPLIPRLHVVDLESARLEEGMLVLESEFDIDIWGSIFSSAQWIERPIIFENEEMTSIRGNTLILSVIEALAGAWSAPLEEVLKASSIRGNWLGVESSLGRTLRELADIIRNPHKFKKVSAPSADVE
jgi:hypothetical protein